MNIEEFGKFFETHRVEVYKLCLNLCRRRSLPAYHAKEVVQESFIRIAKHLDKFQATDNLLPYMTVVSLNLLKRIDRRAKRVVFYGEDVFSQIDRLGIISADAMQEQIGYRELFQDLEGRLTEEQFAALLLRADGMGMYEQAEVLSVTPATVSGRVQRAREQCRSEVLTRRHAKRSDVISPGVSRCIIEQYRAGF